MILSVLSSPALVSGLMVARAKNPVHSVLFPIPVFRDTSGFTFFCNLPLIRKIPNRGKDLLYFLTGFLFSLVLSRGIMELGYVFMEDLARAVAQFYPSSSGGMSGGFNQPPSPEGALPAFHETQDQPGPSASEGEGRAVRDFSSELRNIESLREDKSLDVSYRNALIKQESIVIEMKKFLLPGNPITDEDIQRGVDSYFTATMGLSVNYRRKKLSDIHRDLTDRGSASTYLNAIIKEIESMNGPFF